jgi:hypothetical protein
MIAHEKAVNLVVIFYCYLLVILRMQDNKCFQNFHENEAVNLCCASRVALSIHFLQRFTVTNNFMWF